MAGARPFVVVALALFALGVGLVFWRRVERARFVSSSRIALLTGGALLAAVLAGWLERALFSFVGIGLEPGGRGTLGPLLAALLFVAPLEEALKATVVWPSYVRRRLPNGRVGATYGVVVAAGFAAAETLGAYFIEGRAAWLDIARSAIALPAHLFFAGLWGFVLGSRDKEKWFGPVWLGCALVHGTYDYVVFGRGPAFLVVVVPLLLAMALCVWGLARGKGPVSSRPAPSSVFEVGVGSMRQAMSRPGRPVLLSWIFGGALVTLGVTLVFLGLAVYWGHRFGVDFSLADEAGVSGAVPLGLLGAALLAAFPFSAYLVARASAAKSVLEPAWATGMALVAVIVIFSVTEPTALVVALGVAPVGFALACAGAWFGLDR